MHIDLSDSPSPQFLLRSCLGLGGLALLDVLASDAARGAPTSRAASAEIRSASAPAHPGQGEELHLPVHGRRRQPDGHLRAQAGPLEVRRQADAAAAAHRRRDRHVLRRAESHHPAVLAVRAARRSRAAGCRSCCRTWPRCVDDLAFIHGIKVDNNNHGPAVYHTLTGNQFPGSASIGAWVTYGLGSENRDLPGFIVLGDRRGATIGGAGVWGNGFLPAAYQGTLFRNGATPIVDLKRPPGMTGSRPACRARPPDWLNRQALRRSAPTRANSTPALPPTSSPSACSPRRRSWSISPARRGDHGKLYGLDDPVAEPFGRQCLMARRMVERGVRFVMAAARRGRRPLGRPRRRPGPPPQALPRSGSAGRRAAQGPESPRPPGRDARGLGLGDGPHAVRQQPGHRQARPRSQPVRPGRLDGRRRRQAGLHLRRDRRFLRPRRRRRDPRARRARDDPAPDGPRSEPAHRPACRPLQEADRHRRPGDREVLA